MRAFADTKKGDTTLAEQKCKYLSDDFSEVCVNAECPVCADFCPVIDTPGVCRFEEREAPNNG